MSLNNSFKKKSQNKNFLKSREKCNSKGLKLKNIEAIHLKQLVTILKRLGKKESSSLLKEYVKGKSSKNLRKRNNLQINIYCRIGKKFTNQ